MEFLKLLTPLEWLLAATCILEFNPLLQAYKGWKNESVENVSVGTFFSIFIIGGLWLTYGCNIGSVPLIIGNAIKLISSAMVLAVCFYDYLKIRRKNEAKRN